MTGLTAHPREAVREDATPQIRGELALYLVSWAMAHHQKSSLVIEALERY